MGPPSSKVNIAVAERILLHLWEQDHQADHYLVSREVTRPGIAEICALHPPNVSRTMRELASDGMVSEHTRVVRGDERSQHTSQLSYEGREHIQYRLPELRSTQVLLR